MGLGVAIGPVLGGFLQELAGYGPRFFSAALLRGVGFLCTQALQERQQEQRGSPARDPKVRSLTGVMLLGGLAFGIDTPPTKVGRFCGPASSPSLVLS